MKQDNDACNSSDDDNMLEEDLVDTLPETAIELKYYVETTTIYTLYPNQYFLDGTTLYNKRDSKKYFAYDLQPIRYMRIPLRLEDKSIVLAEIELLLDLSYQEEKYIDELQQFVYSVDGSRKYYDNKTYEDNGTIPEFLLNESN